MLWLFRSVIVLVVYAGITIYTGFRVFTFGRLFFPSLKAFVFWPLYVFLSNSFIVFALLRLDWIEPLRISGLYMFPFFIYLFCFVFLFDMAALAVFFYKRKTGKKTIQLMPKGTGAAFVLTVILLLYGSFHARNIKTTHYKLSFPETKATTETIRIALISDVHIGPIVGKKWLARIVDSINNSSPDLVCITGDIFDRGSGGLPDADYISAELKRINAPLGIYACLGNHDTNRQTRSTNEIVQYLTNMGIVLLADEVAELPGNPGIYMAGRRDARPIGLQNERLSIRELTASIAEKTIILLDHQPLELPLAAEAEIDLILCGHTHRGQFFPGNLFTRFIFKKAGGAHYGLWKKGKTQAVISSGAGIWGPPVRIGTNSELVVLDLQF